MDFKKAFDTVDVNIALKEFDYYGFMGPVQNWFSNYLKGRQQFVSINGISSTKSNITHGFPQGSVLGPLIFLLYINDLPIATNFSASLFADDTTLSKSSNNLTELIMNCNDELDKAAKWFQANKLSLNIDKTNYMIFRTNRMPIDNNSCKISIDNKEIERIGSGCQKKMVKFVGEITR